MRKLPKKHKNIPKVGLGGILDLGGSAIDAVDAIDGKKSMAGAGLSGAAKGAAAGLALGPIGSVAGGIIGGVTSLLTTKNGNDRAAKAEQDAREAKEKAVRTTSV